MVFSSLFFLYAFFAVFILIYFCFAKNIKTKNTCLIIFSLIFYAWGDPAYIWLLLFSTFINYIAGLVIDRFRDTAVSKIGIFMSVAINIGFLMIFKYSGFIVENLNSWFALNLAVPDIKLPIGISFYTFQAMSYTIDCYWDSVKVQKSYSKFLMYVSLFPQLVAGPIVRYSDIEDELTERKTTSEDLSCGISRIVIGLAKKVILADSLYTIVDSFFGGGIKELSVTGTWYAVILYAMYVYFDFSGYSDMAIGMGRILGFHFNENFNYPFLTRDVTEFWQRWHISLGSFFRDYLLYIPVFGKRIPTLNLFIVWFCTGLWHGASWNFVLWGVYYGFFLLLEKFVLQGVLERMPSWLRTVYTMLVVMIGWAFFSQTDFGALGHYLGAMFGIGASSFIDSTALYYLKTGFILLLISILACRPTPYLYFRRLIKRRPAAALVVNLILFALSVAYMVYNSYTPFLYAKF